MKLIVGLGNPGSEYKKNRHNVGFMVADACIDAFGLSFSGEKFKSVFYEGIYNGEPVKLIKPTTYMNLSGEAVIKAAGFFKICAEDILVIYDDFDIPFGTLRLRPGGSSGTHNGARNISQLLGTQAFPKLRIGIGPRPSGRSITSFVLSDFTQDEFIELAGLIPKSVLAIRSLLEEGMTLAMTKWNG